MVSSRDELEHTGNTLQTRDPFYLASALLIQVVASAPLPEKSQGIVTHMYQFGVCVIVAIFRLT